jgi:F1F0 ATPase subunit 2
MTILALPIGVLLGGLYFAGLWWSLAPTRRWRKPFMALGLSWLLRSVLALAGFAALLHAGGPWALGLALLGFLLARSAWLYEASRPLERRRDPEPG